MNALEQFQEEHKKFMESYDEVGIMVAGLNHALEALQHQSALMEKLVGDIMFENLELRQAKWRGES